MKGVGIVSVFLAVMVFIGATMQPANTTEKTPEIKTAVVEVENF